MSIEGFDGLTPRLIAEYRADLLQRAEKLRDRVAGTRALGDVLTPDMIARGIAAAKSVDIRNENPLFPPLFLTFLDYPEFIGPTDELLVTLRERLAATPKLYRETLSHIEAGPMGGLFELAVFGALDPTLGPVTPAPRIPGSKKRGDIAVTLKSGSVVYVEATALDEGKYWRNIERFMREHGLSVHATVGPGPAVEARRIVLKIAHELEQTSPDHPNIICISFFGSSPSPFAIRWAFEDLFSGAKKYGEGIDLSKLERLSAILEFGRSKFTQVHTNPNVAPANRLSDEDVQQLIDSFVKAGRLMIR